MNKLTNKILALLICALMLLAPFAVSAEGELGSEENPHALSASSMRPLRFSVEPGATAWVKSDIGSATVTIGWASSPSYRVSYNSVNHLPETESGENSLYFAITDKNIPFQVVNTGDTAVSFAVMVTPGTPEDRTGTTNYPETIILEENPRTGLLGAFLIRELKDGNGGYHFSLTAPADGAIFVTVSATDADFNDLGWSFNTGNKTSGRYSATHYSSDVPFSDTEVVEVSEGDEVIVMAATFNPDSPFHNPEGTVYVTFSFSEMGGFDFPEPITEPGTIATSLDTGNAGYYYSWVAETDGTLSIEMLDNANWQYGVNVQHENFSHNYYGELHTSSDIPTVPSEELEIVAGSKVIVFVATYNPEKPLSNPEGTVNWKLSFKPVSTTIFGDLDGDEKITPKDVLALRKSLGGVLPLTDAQTEAADCDCDGKLTPKDVLAIRKYLGGVITELPISK